MKESKKSLSKLIKLTVLFLSMIIFLNFTALNLFAAQPGSGDVNDDGYATIADINMITQYRNGSLTFTPEQIAAADVNQDGVVDQHDYDKMVIYTNTIKTLPIINKIAFTSDVHNSTGISNLSTWLNMIANDHTGSRGLDQVFFGGDYNDALDSTDITIETACHTTVNNITKFADTPVYLARGNHDSAITTEYEFSRGLVVDPATNNYGVYIMDIDVTNPLEPFFKSDDITNLGSVLTATPYWVPVIVVSHIPIHCYANTDYNPPYVREYANAGTLLNVLNQHSNVIFLWGHNHSQDDPAYNTILNGTPGTAIQYAYNPPQSVTPIQFTYAPMGAMKDGADQDRYGLLITIERVTASPVTVGTMASLALYDLAGNEYNPTNTSVYQAFY